MTQYDKESEEILREGIGKAYPHHLILGEEFGGSFEKSQSAEYLWLLDPLDGTTNFVHQFPIFCVSIALYYRGEPLYGLIQAPLLKKRYEATAGQGATCNGNPLRVSQRSRLEDSLLATGFASQSKIGLQEQVGVFGEVLKKPRGIRRAGAAALDLCWVAEGVFDGYWEFELSPWDTAAGCLMVREAGGLVTDRDGSLYNPFMKTMVAANSELHKELLQTVRGESNVIL